MTTPQSVSIVTTPPNSGLGTKAEPAFDAVKADIAQIYGNPGAIFFNQLGLTYAGPSSASNSWIFMQQSGLSGVASEAGNGVISPFNLYIPGDTVDTTTNGLGALTGVSLIHAASTGHTGGRTAMQGNVAIVGSPAIAAGGKGYVGGTWTITCNSNLGGTTGAFTNYKGALFGSNASVWVKTGATFVGGANGLEIDVAVSSGASVGSKVGLSIVKTLQDTNRADYNDAGIQFSDQDAAGSTWKYGIQFGAYSAKWAFGADSTLIFVQSRQVGPASSSIALYGVDFRNCTFQSGGAAFISTGFQVDPNGNTTVATVATTGKQVINNNAAATYTFPANSAYVGFTGTNVGTVAFTLPAAAASLEGRIYTVFTHSAIGTSTTWTSSGATFVDAPATLGAASVTRFIYDHASLQWLRA